MKKKVSFPKVFHPFMFALSILINLVMVGMVLGSLTDWYLLNDYYNSDALYLPCLYRDLFINHMGLEGWVLNPAPNFIPEWPLYFLIRWISGDFRIAMFIYSLAMFTLVTLCTAWLFKTVFQKINGSYLCLISLGFSIFLLSYFPEQDFIHTEHLLKSAFHTGAYLMALISLALFFKYLKNNKLYLLLILFVTISCGALSDKLFLVFFSIPVLGSLLFVGDRQNRIKIVTLVSTTLTGSGLGLLVFHLIDKAQMIDFTQTVDKFLQLDNTGNSISEFSKHMYMLLSGNPYHAAIVIFTFLSLIAALFLSIKALFPKPGQTSLFENTSQRIFVIVSIILIAGIIANPVLNGCYIGITIIRYNVYGFYFALGLYVVYFFLLSEKYRRLKLLFTPLLISVIALILIQVFFILNNKRDEISLNELCHYYPQNAARIDSVSALYNLQYGVGQYWDAKHTSMFSKQGVKVFAVCNDLHPYHHVMNKNWFLQTPDKDDKPVFSFIIGDEIFDTTKLKPLFGERIDTVELGYIQLYLVPDFIYFNEILPPILLDSTTSQSILQTDKFQLETTGH